MPIRSRAAAAAVHILTALCAAVGVVLQCGFFGGRLNLAALQYFTLMSNILCAVYFAGAAVRTLRRGDTWLPVCKGALVMAMAITGITFHLFLAAALAELYPEVKLGKYKGLAAPMPQAELSNDDVDKAESEWLQAHLVEEERDRAAMGDEVTLDFDGSVDGVPFDGGKAENYPLLLGSGMFIDGFEEQVAGIRPEEEREIHVTFPQQYTPELAGKAAVFRVKAHRIVRRSMPELNDEFARAQGFSDAAALRQAIMSAALQRKETQARDAYADALVRQVLDGMEVRVPDSMVESQLTGLLQELENRLMSQGASLSDYLQMAGMTEEDLRSHARENALESARYELAMTEIARLEHIRVTDEDVERRYQEMSRQFGVPVDHIRQQLPPMQLSHDLKLAYARAVVVDSGVRL